MTDAFPMHPIAQQSSSWAGQTNAGPVTEPSCDSRTIAWHDAGEFRKLHLKELIRLQHDLVKLQDWIDCGWYSRAGVERVMGFCTDEGYRRSCSSPSTIDRHRRPRAGNKSVTSRP